MVKDIEIGKKILFAMSELDIGQGICVQEGQVLAVEAIEGTDKMLERVADLKCVGKKPILIKMIKHHQDRDLDMPTIGINTIENLYKFGFAGCAVSVDGIIVLEREKVIQRANELGIFILGI